MRICGRMERDTLVIAGLTTECCVDSTARDAFERDYHVFIASDAVAAYEADLHDGALKALELNCAMLATSCGHRRRLEIVIVFTISLGCGWWPRLAIFCEMLEEM